MPMYQFEAMDRTGQEIRDVIEAPSEEDAQNTIRQMGYFVTKLSLKKGTAVAAGKKGKDGGRPGRHGEKEKGRHGPLRQLPSPISLPPPLRHFAWRAKAPPPLPPPRPPLPQLQHR